MTSVFKKIDGRVVLVGNIAVLHHLDMPDRHGYDFLAERLEGPSFEPSNRMAKIRLPWGSEPDVTPARQPSRSWKWRGKRMRRKPTRLRTQHGWGGVPSARLLSMRLVEEETKVREVALIVEEKAIAAFDDTFEDGILDFLALEHERRELNDGKPYLIPIWQDFVLPLGPEEFGEEDEEEI